MMITYTNRLSLVLPLILAAACGEKDKEKDKDEEKPSEPAATAVSDEKKAEAKAPLPKINLELVSADKMNNARKRNQAGLEKQRAKDYDGAIAQYRKALALDPGHLTARYNLSTALALAGNKNEALLILTSLAVEKNCPVCAGRLARAKKDSDFDGIRDDPAFKALVEKPGVKKISVKKAAEKVLETLTDKESGAKLADIHFLIHPRSPVKFTTLSANCDPEPGEDCKSHNSTVGTKAFGDEVDLWTVNPAKVKKCDKKCCTLEFEAGGGDIGIGVEKMCFTRDSGGVLTLSSIDATEGA